MKFNKNIIIASLVLFSAAFLEGCKDDKVAPLPNSVTTTGTVTTIAGSGAFGASNGTGTAASFNYPNALAIDGAGNILIADKGNNQIRKVTPAGVVSAVSGTLLAGSANATKIGDAASFNGPTGVVVDRITGNIFVADFGNQTIRKIEPTGAVSVYAGTNGKSGFTNTTPAVGTTAAVPGLFNNPAGLAIDATGNLYVADYTNNLIRKVLADGSVSTFAGKSAGNVDGIGVAASFSGPRALVIDAAGNLFVADANNNSIRKIDVTTGAVTTFAGSGKIGNADGSGKAASFSHPSGITIDAAGNLYVADAGNNLVRKITPAGVVTSLAGSGYSTLVTPFNGPSAVVADNAGAVYVANTLGNLIQVIK